MRKILIGLVAFLLLVACGEKETTTEVKEPQVKQEEPKKEEVKQEQSKSLSGIVNHFKDNGFIVGDVHTKAFEMLGAVDGFGIDVDGEQIEFYLFDRTSANEETLKNLEDAEVLGKINMSGFSIPAKINEDIILLRYDEHPNKDKVIETFNNY